MVAIEPLTGARVPEQSDGPLGGLQAGNAVKDLADNTIPRFASGSARNTAYAAWVTAGGTMVAGLHCTVAGQLMRYDGTAWRYAAHLPVATMAARPVGSDRYVGLRIQPQDDPSTLYTWTSANVWVPDGWPRSIPTGLPSGAYLVSEGGSTVTSTNEAGAYSIPFPAMAAAPFDTDQSAGDVTGNLGFVRPTHGSYTSTGLTGLACQPGGSAAASQPLVRVNWQAFGYRT